MTLAPFGTGIYVHRVKTAGSGYYAVSRCVDGAEDLSTWIPGFNTTAAGTTETLGTRHGPAVEGERARRPSTTSTTS